MNDKKRGFCVLCRALLVALAVLWYGCKEGNDEQPLNDEVPQILNKVAGEDSLSRAALPAQPARASTPVPPVREVRDHRDSGLDGRPVAGGKAAKRRPETGARLWLDDLKYVHRTEITDYPSGMVALVVTYDGKIVLRRNINCQMRYRHHAWAPGTYEIYLGVRNSGAREYDPISNIVSYTIGMGDDPRTWLYVPVEDFVDYPPREELTASVELDENNTVTRSKVAGTDLKSLGWVVKYNGHVVLQRAARNERRYRYFGDQPGRYSVFLTSWTGSKLCYGRISNIVTYTLP